MNQCILFIRATLLGCCELEIDGNKHNRRAIILVPQFPVVIAAQALIGIALTWKATLS